MIISCARTNLPILGGADWQGHPFSRAVLLREDHPPVAGWYDGTGRLGGLDLAAAGLLDDIRAGTACMVLGDHHRPDDTPARLGPSRIEADPARRPGKAFVAACACLGGFTTYDGYVLARDGKVSPDVAATLDMRDIVTLRILTAGVRGAVARRLVAWATGETCRRGSERSLSGSIGLDVVPVAAGCRQMHVVGGAGPGEVGMPLGPGIDGPGAIADLDNLAADLINWFPPRRKAQAVLTRDEASLGSVTLYESRELGVAVYVSRTPDGVGLFASPALALEDLGLAEDEAADLALAVRALVSGVDSLVELPGCNEWRL